MVRIFRIWTDVPDVLKYLPDVLLGVVDCVVFFVGDFVGDFVDVLLSISSIESKMILIKRQFL